jgi:hypothetical protein
MRVDYDLLVQVGFAGLVVEEELRRTCGALRSLRQDSPFWFTLDWLFGVMRRGRLILLPVDCWRRGRISSLCSWELVVVLDICQMVIWRKGVPDNWHLLLNGDTLGKSIVLDMHALEIFLL